MEQPNDAFELYNLRVELIQFSEWRTMTDGAKIWDYFEVKWENLYFPIWQWFSFYNLAAIIPLLAAKQRVTHSNDWMSTDSDVSAVDIHCWAIFRITRTGTTTFYHHQVSGENLNNKKHELQ